MVTFVNHVELRSLLMTSLSKLYISLKSFFFDRDWAGSASDGSRTKW